MYTGALFTVAELPPGILTLMSFDDRFYPILKDLKMEFLTMAKSDVTVEFEMPSAYLAELKSEAIKNGKCAFSLVGELKDINNVVVAKSYANYQVRTRTK